MKFASLLLLLLTAVPGWGESLRPLDVSFDAVIETIQFQDVSDAKRQLVLRDLAVRVGDRLSVKARHAIGHALSAAQGSVAEKRLTFTYTSGTTFGTARVLISAGC